MKWSENEKKDPSFLSKRIMLWLYTHVIGVDCTFKFQGYVPFLKGFIIVRGNRVLFYWNTCTSRGYLLSTFFFYDDKSNTFSASKFPKSIEFILKFTGAFNKIFHFQDKCFFGGRRKGKMLNLPFNVNRVEACTKSCPT